jgi:hypothetical protein
MSVFVSISFGFKFLWAFFKAVDLTNHTQAFDSSQFDEL